CGERARQGHAGPDHGGVGRRVPAVRLRRAQGLRDAGAQRSAATLRTVPGAPVLVRECRRRRDRWKRVTSAWRPAAPVRGAGGGGDDCGYGQPEGWTAMSAEDLEKYETDMELQLYREYRDIVRQFSYVVETERRFYLAN